MKAAAGRHRLGINFRRAFEYCFGFGQAIWERASLDMKNASITHWVQPENANKWLLERFNDAGHL
jgi:hypothetical protein